MPRARRCPRHRAGYVRLIAPDRVGSGAGVADETSDRSVLHQRQEHRRVAGVPRCQQRDQREAVAIDELVDRRRQAAAGAADRLARRLDVPIRVIRSGPLSGASCSSRADAQERSVESTDSDQSTSPASSATAVSAASTATHVPSVAMR